MWMTLLTLLWGAWLTQAALCVVLARRFGRRVPRPGEHEYSRYRPHCFVIVPFKGDAHEVERAVQGLCTQEHRDYELILVLESERDPAYAALVQALKAQPQTRVEILFAGKAPPDQGQKTHNQLAALRHIEPRVRDDDVYVFRWILAYPDGVDTHFEDSLSLSGLEGGQCSANVKGSLRNAVYWPSFHEQERSSDETVEIRRRTAGL